MPKVRIYDLSKQLGVNNSDIIQQLNQYNAGVKYVPSNSIDEVTLNRLTTDLRKTAVTAGDAAPPSKAKREQESVENDQKNAKSA